MDWLVGTLKPYIDATYRTLPDREHTAIGGSSMGGLMSLYAACCYNNVFQRAAALSPSLWVNQEATLGILKAAEPKPDTCIYMDYGSEELDNHFGNMEVLRGAVDILLQKELRLTFRIVPGGSHCEASWEKQIPVFMQCLNL
jgi:predicted alpha/beta superfamily hydrolase